MPTRLFAVLITTVLAVGLAGCDKGDGHDHDHDHGHGHGHDHDHGHGHDHDHGSGGHGHHHEAPHGGTLIALGDHVAHLELALDAETGKLTMWLLDGEAEKPVRSELESMTLTDVTVVVDPSASPHTPPFDLTLKAVASELTGETVGDSATFVATDERLKVAERFTAAMSGSLIPGVGDKVIEIKFPEGNEE